MSEVILGCSQIGFLPYRLAFKICASTFSDLRMYPAEESTSEQEAEALWKEIALMKKVSL